MTLPTNQNDKNMAIIYKEGSTNREMVKRIQRIVGCCPDGIWKKLTTEAVKAWQRDHNLVSDGIVGPATLAAMGIAAVASAVTPQKAPQTVRHGDISLRKSKRRIDYIVVHCTATPEGQAKSVGKIRSEHMAQGWSDIGYHYVVTLDGKAHLGRSVDVSGAHVGGYNAHSIGVVYVGGLESDPRKAYSQLKPKDTRTDAQKAELLSLLIDLRKLYPDARILGHRDFSPDKNGDGVISVDEEIKACPSFDAKTEYRCI